MQLWFISLVFLALSVTLAHSWCRDPHGTISDYNKTCKGWWKKALRYHADGWRRKACVNKIREKCPNFLQINDKHEVSVYNVYIRRMTWKIVVQACDNEGHCVQYYTYKETDICKGDDSDLGTCLSWWIAAYNVISNHIIDRCMRLIEKECPKKLFKVSESKEETHHKGKRATAISITYKYPEHHDVSFTRYEYNKEY